MVNRERVIMAVIVAVVLLTAGLTLQKVTSDTYQERVQQEMGEARAYCNQVYGNPQIVMSNVVGGHGGTHCLANLNGPHLHTIPERYIEQAYQAEQAGRDLGWDVETARQQAEPKPIYTSPLLLIPALALVIAVLLSYVQNWRRGSSPS